jgi:hypothetical protein
MPEYLAELEVWRLGQIAPQGALYTGFSWLAGRPIAFLGFRDLHILTLDGVTGAYAPLSAERLTEAAKLIVPDGPVIHTELRTTPDRYWHCFHVPRGVRRSQWHLAAALGPGDRRAH